MPKHVSFHDWLLGSVSRTYLMSADEAGAAADAGGGAAAPAAVAAAGGGAAGANNPAPAAVAAAPAAENKDAPPDLAGDALKLAAAKDGPAEGGAPAAEETAEQKAEREQKERENETPEQKAAREKVESEAKATEVAATLKSYDALKIPDGIDPGGPALTIFKNEAAAMGMPLEQAQTLVGKVAPEFQAQLEAPYKAWGATQAKWIDEVKADPVLGGAAFTENLGVIGKALKRFGTPELGQALFFTGAGNNPHVLRFLHKVGSEIGESSFVGGERPAGQHPEKLVGTGMYPTMQPGAEGKT